MLETTQKKYNQKKYNLKRIGEIHTSNEGYRLEIVDGGSKNRYCTIKIDDKYTVELQYSKVKRGVIKNKYHQSVFGIGYLGIGEYKAQVNKKLTKAYRVWRGMLTRAYSKEFHERQPTYRDVTVCEDWHNFQNFAEWYELNYVDGYDIDKDLLSGEDKVYSPKTCIFIPQSLNSFLTNKKSTNTTGFIGISKDRKGYKAEISNGNGKTIHIGSYQTKQEAAKAYQAQREVYANDWKEKMQGILPKQAIERIA